MSVDRHDLESGVPDDVRALLARAAAADSHVRRRLATIGEDLARRDDGWLDDESRAAIWTGLARLVGAIAADIRHHAGRVLPAPALGDRAVMERMVAAGLLDDQPLVGELLARAWSEIIAAGLPPATHENSDQPSLLPRLANGPDRLIASAATALMVAEGRRRGHGLDVGRDDLPADLHHLLVWWVAAALRPDDAGTATDAALVEAAQRALAAHDEGARVEAAAERLAAALECDAATLEDVLVEVLGDRLLPLFGALIAHALGLDGETVRAAIVEPGGERLLMMLRALDLSPTTIARVALALAEADRRRTEAQVADQLEVVFATPVKAARQAVAAMKVPRAYRVARDRMGRA